MEASDDVAVTTAGVSHAPDWTDPDERQRLAVVADAAGSSDGADLIAAHAVPVEFGGGFPVYILQASLFVALALLVVRPLLVLIACLWV